MQTKEKIKLEMKKKKKIKTTSKRIKKILTMPLLTTTKKKE